jgi:hypothetical protein
VPSALALNKWSPVGEKAKDLVCSLWPMKRANGFPVTASHKRTVESPSAVASLGPSTSTTAKQRNRLVQFLDNSVKSVSSRRFHLVATTFSIDSKVVPDQKYKPCLKEGAAFKTTTTPKDTQSEVRAIGTYHQISVRQEDRKHIDDGAMFVVYYILRMRNILASTAPRTSRHVTNADG